MRIIQFIWTSTHSLMFYIWKFSYVKINICYNKQQWVQPNKHIFATAGKRPQDLDGPDRAGSQDLSELAKTWGGFHLFQELLSGLLAVAQPGLVEALRLQDTRKFSRALLIIVWQTVLIDDDRSSETFQLWLEPLRRWAVRRK